MEQKPKEGDREFSGRGMASIFGAPISWIALFGALMGALSIVPMIFYPFGGGFASAGMIIFGPMSGLVLGPWAGAVAGLVGGLIGMFISPGSYPLGLIDVFLSGVFLPIFWGLAKPYYRILYSLYLALDRILHPMSILYSWTSSWFRCGSSTHVFPFVHLGAAWASVRHPDAKDSLEMDEGSTDRKAVTWLYPIHGWTDLCLVAPLDRCLFLGT
jgi:hypothetical protein